jgi:hypothetical protein
VITASDPLAELNLRMAGADVSKRAAGKGWCKSPPVVALRRRYRILRPIPTVLADAAAVDRAPRWRCFVAPVHFAHSINDTSRGSFHETGLFALKRASCGLFFMLWRATERVMTTQVGQVRDLHLYRYP